MGFLSFFQRVINRSLQVLAGDRSKFILIVCLTLGIVAPLRGLIHGQISMAQPPDARNRSNHGALSQKQVHSLPETLETWSPTLTKDDYFQAISPLPLGYLIWSNRPVSVYVNPSAFSDDARSQAWETSVQLAMEDWQVYFPLERSQNPQAQIVIEQVRPQRTSNGRIRSAQAIPKLGCQGDRLTHQFTIQINPSQTARYIRSATRHEIGHALGIWGHSDNPEDVMYKAQVSNPPEISERDINTLKKIYTQPTLLGWSSPQYCSAPTPKH